MADNGSSFVTTDAEEVIERFLSNLDERRIALRQLVASVDHAISIAPDAWGVTLYPDIFRLNVGQVEVLVVGQDFIRLNCVGKLGTFPFVGSYFEQPVYRSVLEPYCAFVGNIDFYPTIEANLQHPHKKFIEQAARNRAGKPRRGSPFTKSHNEGLITYARNFLRTSIPRVSRIELAADLNFPASSRIQVTVTRIVRDTQLAVLVKQQHDHRCQICGETIQLSDGTRYAEGHHIRPLGSPHDGPDVAENIICLCPNHHAACDLGAIRLDLHQLRLAGNHKVSEQFIAYHNEVIFRVNSNA